MTSYYQPTEGDRAIELSSVTKFFYHQRLLEDAKRDGKIYFVTHMEQVLRGDGNNILKRVIAHEAKYALKHGTHAADILITLSEAMS